MKRTTLSFLVAGAAGSLISPDSSARLEVEILPDDIFFDGIDSLSVDASNNSVTFDRTEDEFSFLHDTTIRFEFGGVLDNGLEVGASLEIDLSNDDVSIDGNRDAFLSGDFGTVTAVDTNVFLDRVNPYALQTSGSTTVVSDPNNFVNNQGFSRNLRISNPGNTDIIVTMEFGMSAGALVDARGIATLEWQGINGAAPIAGTLLPGSNQFPGYIGDPGIFSQYLAALFADGLPPDTAPMLDIIQVIGDNITGSEIVTDSTGEMSTMNANFSITTDWVIPDDGAIDLRLDYFGRAFSASFAQAQGVTNLSGPEASAQISLALTEQVSVVPVPASLSLLLSALGFFLYRQRSAVY